VKKAIVQSFKFYLTSNIFLYANESLAQNEKTGMQKSCTHLTMKKWIQICREMDIDSEYSVRQQRTVCHLDKASNTATRREWAVTRKMPVILDGNHLNGAGILMSIALERLKITGLCFTV